MQSSHSTTELHATILLFLTLADGQTDRQVLLASLCRKLPKTSQHFGG